ncbi:MAG: hypothetical protein QOH10_2639 [Actinomycetota bacterium]|jgi:hypothetical protein|nr:hypothetical protein [Actinomycetota bacterium]
MTRNKLLVAALALGAACGLAGTVGVLPAVGQSSPPSSPVILGRTARILYRGAVARTVVYVVCQPGDFAQLSISLTERSGSGIASGAGFVDSVSCTGQIQTITVPVTAFGKRFVKGTAFGQATLFDCGDFFCGESNDSHSVELKTRHK